MTTTDEFDFGLGSDVPDDPNTVPDGTYKAVVDEVKFFTHQAREEGKNRFVIFTYKIVDPEAGVALNNTVDEWKSCNKGDDTKKKSFLKQRFLSLGVSKEDVESGNIAFRKLVGIPVLIKVKNNNGYTNINSLTLADDSGWGKPAPASAQVSSQTQSASVPAGNVPDLDF